MKKRNLPDSAGWWWFTAKEVWNPPKAPTPVRTWVTSSGRVFVTIRIGERELLEADIDVADMPGAWGKKCK